MSDLPPPNDTFSRHILPYFFFGNWISYVWIVFCTWSQVADMVKAKDSNVDMRCIFDGLDFIPTEVNKTCFYIQSWLILTWRLNIKYQIYLTYDSIAGVGKTGVWLKADVQSGSRVLKQVFWTFFLSIFMAYNVISCQKVAENNQILKIAKFAM